MSISRVLIRQDKELYRFLKLEARPDGSLLIFLDRDPTKPAGVMILDPESNQFIPVPGNLSAKLPHAKISCHTTGEVHYDSGRTARKTFYIEPLYALSRSTSIGFFSLPRIDRLDRLNRDAHKHEAESVLQIPAGIEERVTFVIDLAGTAPTALDTYGVVLTYEVYSAIVRLVPVAPVQISEELSEHFVQGIIVNDFLSSRAVNMSDAEIDFHRKVHSHKGPIIFRETGGAYVAIAAVPMIRPPVLTIAFTRSDLAIELIPYEENRSPAHKVRFWICDRGGRNKTEDLRAYISSIKFDASL